MAAGRFKDRCLKVLDQVAATRTPVTITKRGKPVATVVPYTARVAPVSGLAGSVLKEPVLHGRAVECRSRLTPTPRVGLVGHRRSAASRRARQAIEQAARTDGVWLSAISIWEVAKNVEKQQIVLDRPVRQWIDQALALSGLLLAELTPVILLDSCELPQPFQGETTHRRLGEAPWRRPRYQGSDASHLSARANSVMSRLATCLMGTRDEFRN
jgi:prevent-host-death family protein